MNIDRAREVQDAEHDRRTIMTTESELLEKKFEQEATEEVMNHDARGQWLKEIVEDLNIPDCIWDELFDKYTENEEKFILDDGMGYSSYLGWRIHKILYPILVEKLKKEIDFSIDRQRDKHEDTISGWRGE